MDALVLCLHQQGNAHLELLGKDSPACGESPCEQDPAELVPDHCPPCVDFVFGSAELGPQLSNHSSGPSLPQWILQSSSQETHFPAPAPKTAFVAATPSRGPPATEPLCELIRRTSVLRL